MIYPTLGECVLCRLLQGQLPIYLLFVSVTTLLGDSEHFGEIGDADGLAHNQKTIAFGKIPFL
ncbi:hypothetical protein Holit_02500 [Hollandina sp. SP2]